MSKVNRLMIVLCATVALAGCGGGESSVKSEVTTTTAGQQLMDLKKALDSGAMTQSEYEKERKKVLDK